MLYIGNQVHMNTAVLNKVRFQDGTELSSASSNATPSLSSLSIGEFTIDTDTQNNLRFENGQGGGFHLQRHIQGLLPAVTVDGVVQTLDATVQTLTAYAPSTAVTMNSPLNFATNEAQNVGSLGFADGTTMTTAAAVSPYVLTHTNTQGSTSSWTESNILTDATKSYRVIYTDVRMQGTGDLELKLYSAANNIIPGDAAHSDMRSGTNGVYNITAGIQNIILNEAAHPVGAGQITKIELDVYQRAGSRGNITITTHYLNSSSRACERRQVLSTNGTQVVGFNLTGAGSVGGSVKVIAL